LGAHTPPLPAPAASLPRPSAPFVFTARASQPPPWAAAAPARLVVSLGTASAFPHARNRWAAMLRSGGGRTKDTVRARAQKPTRNGDVGEGGFGLTKFTKTQ
jgi:hypothetical protein